MINKAMADISIQFHAALEELLVFVKQSATDFSLTITAIKYFPFEARVIGIDLLDEIFPVPSIRRLTFSLGEPLLNAANATSFADQNPDNLILDIGRRTGKGLGESWLHARTSNPDALNIWKQIAKRLRRDTVVGAVAVNSKTGGTARIRDHRFTNGAKAMEAQGVPVLSSTGVLMRLGKEQ